jgi:hypothetical protein
MKLGFNVDRLSEHIPVVKVRFLMVGTADPNLVRIVLQEGGV